MTRRITKADLLAPEDYAAQRRELRRKLIEYKKNRRLLVGPFATFYFESFETMKAQIQEMLHIEKGGDEQLKDELGAYNPLVPQGRELVATLMFEIDNPIQRAKVLAELGGIEHRVFLKVGDQDIAAIADDERTNEKGKTSSVHFLHFPFSVAQIESFTKRADPVILGFTHPGYAHMAVLPDKLRLALADDFIV